MTKTTVPSLELRIAAVGEPKIGMVTSSKMMRLDQTVRVDLIVGRQKGFVLVSLT